MKGGRTKTRIRIRNKEWLKTMNRLVLYVGFFVFFSWFHCDSCWSVAVLLCRSSFWRFQAIFGSEHGPPHHLLSCSGSCVPLLWRHLQPAVSTCFCHEHNTTLVLFLLGETERRRGFFNFVSLKMDLFKVISAETNPPEEVAVSIAHDLLVFRGTSGIGIDF